jgi:hypothetical protein
MILASIPIMKKTTIMVMAIIIIPITILGIIAISGVNNLHKEIQGDENQEGGENNTATLVPMITNNAPLDISSYVPTPLALAQQD